jgi:hypothetical protein
LVAVQPTHLLFGLQDDLPNMVGVRVGCFSE